MNTSEVNLLSFSDAARLLGISLRQFRRLVDSGRLAVVRVTERTPRVRQAELAAFVAAATERREVLPQP